MAALALRFLEIYVIVYSDAFDNIRLKCHCMQIAQLFFFMFQASDFGYTKGPVWRLARTHTRPLCCWRRWLYRLAVALRRAATLFGKQGRRPTVGKTSYNRLRRPLPQQRLSCLVVHVAFDKSNYVQDRTNRNRWFHFQFYFDLFFVYFKKQLGPTDVYSVYT